MNLLHLLFPVSDFLPVTILYTCGGWLK